MREAIGGTWLFQIVIVFVLLFTGFMCLTINHSKAFNVKNTIIKTIEREEGVNLDVPGSDPAISKIVSYLQEASYRTTGNCPADVKDAANNIIAHYYGFDRNGNLNNAKPAFCIAKVKTRAGEEFPDMSYYRVVVFYQLDLPIFNEVFNFRVTGDTKLIDVSGGNS